MNLAIEKIPSIVFYFVLVSFFSCKKNQTTNSTLKFTDGFNVYIAGTQNGNAVYWKNGTSITIDTNAEALSIAVIDSNVYTSGLIYSGNTNIIATYWKNDQRFQLEGNGTSHAFSIALNGADVYCAGDVFGATYPGSVNAVYWKNGSRSILSPSRDGIAQCITIAPPEIYIGGYVGISGPDTSVVWKDGTLYSYIPGVFISSIAFTPSDTLIVGSGYNSPWLIDANNYVNLSKYGGASSIAVSGQNVYIGGNIQDSLGQLHAAYWKNGNLIQLSSGVDLSYVTGIAVAGSDVYAVGDYIPAGAPGFPVYWKNSVMQKLANSGSVSSISITKNH